MFREIIGRWLDNGFSLKRAIHDMAELKKNVKQLPDNIIKYKNLLDSKIGISVYESAVYSENSITVELFEKDKKTSFNLWEYDFLNKDANQYFIDTTVVADNAHAGSEFPNYIKGYLYNIENGKTLLLDKEDILKQLPLLLNQTWKGQYVDLPLFLEKLTNDVNNTINSNA